MSPEDLARFDAEVARIEATCRIDPNVPCMCRDCTAAREVEVRGRASFHAVVKSYHEEVYWSGLAEASARLKKKDNP